MNLTPPPRSYSFVGDLVAMGAGRQALVERLALEMAEETGGRRHRHVLPLHDLAVATGAAQLHAAARVAHVRRVVEMESP